MSPLSRDITHRLLKALNASPIVFLNGARQTGKSTLVQSIAPLVCKDGTPAPYISFDRPVNLAAASAAPEAFLAAHKDCVILDEVQMAPTLFRALKVAVDDLRLRDKENANGRYLLTGSVNIMALPSLSDALVGRMSVLTLYPFCTAEARSGKGDGLDRILNLDFAGISDHGLSVIEAIKMATYPEIAFKNDTDRGIWMDGYVTTLLQRDVKLLADVDKLSVLPLLLRLLATRAGNLLNDAEIARDAGLNAVTGKSYRQLLKTMFINFDVPPWYRNISKRLVKASKGYLTDTQMLCHMLDLRLEDIQQNKPDLFGHVLENYVATELTKLLSFGDTRAQLLHFRTSDGKEVDFVIEKPDGSLFGIEIKKSESVTIKDFKGLHVLAELTGKDFMGGIVLYSGREVVPFGKNLYAVPFHILWQ